MLTIPREALGEIDLATRLEEASNRPGDFFPSRLAFEAAREAPQFLESLGRRLVRGYDPHPAESVEVPKWGGATRPALDLAIADRLTFDALVWYLRSKVIPGLVNVSPSPGDRQTVEAALIDGTHEYLLVTDIASFYEYIRHEILLTELLDLTGEEAAVDALGALLAATMQRQVGIPQGPAASGYLADVYASIADRHLARMGFDVTRISDDYRVPVATWRDAGRAQLRLEQALRGIGLVINAGKTFTPSRETYATWIPQQWIPVVDENGAPSGDTQPTEADAEDFEVPYPVSGWGATEAMPLEEVNPDVVAEFEGLLAAADYWGQPENARQSYRLTQLLPQVAQMDTSAATASLDKLLGRFPHLTKEVAVLLRRRLGTGAEADALSAIDAAIHERQYLFDWQLGFLLHALIPAEENLPPRLIDVARDELFRQGAPWFSRGRAALVMASKGQLEASSPFLDVYESAPAATKPDLLGAVSTVVDAKAGTELVRSESRDPLLARVPDVIARNERYKW